MTCKNCGIEFNGRKDAKYCSPKCKLQAFRKESIETDNVTFSNPLETDNFEYYTISKVNGLGRIEDEKSIIRTAKYWYDVPLGAVPVVKKGWPKMPEFMNGRQYFLWWKNDFETHTDKEKGEPGTPIILNPYPQLQDVTYVKAGAESRRWGA